MIRFFIGIFLLCFLQSIYSNEVIKVNDEIIEQRFITYIKDEVEKQGRTVTSEMEENIIDRLIDLKVINQAAKKSGLLDEPTILTQAQLSAQELIYTLYLQRYILNNPISESEVKKQYSVFKKNFNEREFKAKHILLSKKNEAEKIIAKLKKNENFNKLAQEFSIDDSSKDHGGDLGWFNGKDMLTIIYKEVKNLNKGSFTTKPIQSQFGWHVIKLIDSRKAPLPTFEDKEEEIKTSLQKTKLKKHLDSLRSSAKILIPN